MRREVFLRCSLFVAALMFLMVGTARADLTGTDVTAGITFDGEGGNYYSPATQTVLAGGTTWLYNDTANDDPTTITSNEIEFTDHCEYGSCEDNVNIILTYTDPAFAGATLTTLTDTFPSSYGLSGDTITVNIDSWSGGLTNNLDIGVNYTTPEPSTSSMLLSGVGLIGLMLMIRKRASRGQQTA